MSSQLSPSQPEPLQAGLLSTPQSHVDLQSDLRLAGSKILRYWMQKTVPIAIAVGVIPVLGMGALNLALGKRIVQNATSPQVAQEVQQSARSWWIVLLLGAGFTSILTGALAWLWLKVFVNALVKQSTQLAIQSDRLQVSASLQDLGYTVGLLQEQTSISDVLETAAIEVRSLFKADRVLVLDDDASGHALRAEDKATDHPSFLEKAQLSMSLEELFRVPLGYVQVCSEVNGSNLSELHQQSLTELGVQSQMVTQMTLDNECLGVLVVQCSSPRDWTEVEHQLFATIAKQIAIALDRKTGPAPTLSVTGMGDLWSDYHRHSLDLAQSSRAQAHGLRQIMTRMQNELGSHKLLEQGLQQVQDHLQNYTKIIHSSEGAVERSMTSITQMQETLVQSHHSSEQLIDIGQKISQASTKIKHLASRVNHQAMNASIAAKKNGITDVDWAVNLTNDLLQLTRELAHQTNEVDKFSSQLLIESDTLSTSADTGNEQLLVSAEWFRDSRQQWHQIVAVNDQLESSLRRLKERHQERVHNTTLSYQQVLELSHWLNQTVEGSDAMLHAIEQLTSRALA